MPPAKKTKRPKPPAKTTRSPAAKRGKAAKPRANAAPRSAGKKPARPREASVPAEPPSVAPPAPMPVQRPVEPPPIDPAVAALIGTPESRFAARVPSELPERPLPARRRAIFVDVENTSRVVHIESALRELSIDHSFAVTDLVASGNWRVIGSETARLLAVQGAQLMHSAPATGVRDWSDLRIAVAAGAWLASARAGDRLEIVSDDRAFDAVGDVAASRGVEFRRWSYRTSGSAASTSRPVVRAHAAPPSGPRGGRGARNRPRPNAQPTTTQATVEPSTAVEAVSAPETAPVPSHARRHAPAKARPAPSSPGGARSGHADSGHAASGHVAAGHAAPGHAASGRAAPGHPASGHAASGHASSAHAAPVESLLEVTRELLARSPRGVNIDTIGQRLKALGFDRPPGSPRLVTRLRGLKELAVSDNGMVRLAGEASAATPPVDVVAASPAVSDATTVEPAAPSDAPSAKRRSSRRRKVR